MAQHHTTLIIVVSRLFVVLSLQSVLGVVLRRNVTPLTADYGLVDTHYSPHFMTNFFGELTPLCAYVVIEPPVTVTGVLLRSLHAHGVPTYVGSAKFAARNCPNHFIAVQDLKSVYSSVVRDLRRDAKIVILTHQAQDIQLLAQVVKQDVWLDVRVAQFTGERITSSMLQLGIVTGRNGNVNLDGRKLSICAFHNPPLVVSLASAPGGLDGVEARVVRELGEALNFTWQAHVPSDGLLWGSKDSSGNWSGLKGELQRGAADIGIGMLYVTEEHVAAFQLTYPYTIVCLTFLVPAPKTLLGYWDALLRPLRASTWLYLIGIAVAHTAASYLITKKSICSNLVEMVRVLALVSGPQPPSGRLSGRLLFLNWAFGSLLVAVFYCSELSSWMVAQATEPPIRTVDDFARSEVTWGRRDDDLVTRLMHAPNPSQQTIGNKFRLETTEEDIEEHVLQGGYGVFVHVLSDGYPAGAEFLSPPARSKLISLQECLVSEYVSIGLRPGLPLARAMTVSITRLQEAGLLQAWQTRDVHKYGDGAVYQNQAPASNNQLTPLHITNLISAFALLLAGLLVAMATFVTEMCGHRALISICTGAVERAPSHLNPREIKQGPDRFC